MKTKRAVVLKSGYDETTGFYFHPEMLTLADESIPVVTYGVHEAVVGQGNSMKFDKSSGELTFDITVEDDFDLDLFNKVLFVTGPVTETREDVRHIIGGKIRLITLIPFFKLKFWSIYER